MTCENERGGYLAGEYLAKLGHNVVAHLTGEPSVVSTSPLLVPEMHSPPFRRLLAVFLACQPVFWMSNVALAQAIRLTPPAGPIRVTAGGWNSDQQQPPLAVDGHRPASFLHLHHDEPMLPDVERDGVADAHQLAVPERVAEGEKRRRGAQPRFPPGWRPQSRPACSS